MKILHLTLKKRWFDLIRSGRKIHEYREHKPYWDKRLVNENGEGKKFYIIRFKNGYGENVPTMEDQLVIGRLLPPQVLRPVLGSLTFTTRPCQLQ